MYQYIVECQFNFEMQQLQALGFVDSDQKQKTKNSKEVTKEKKRSAELSNEMVKKISQPGEKRTPENKAEAASPTTQRTEDIVSSEGWLVINLMICLKSYAF